MNIQLVIIAFSPAILMVWFFYARSVYKPEGRLVIAGLFLLGGLGSAFLALVLNQGIERYTTLWSGSPNPLYFNLYWWIGIGMNEEFAKMVILLIVLYPRRDFSTPMQGLLGGATVALGFAAFENVLYLVRHGPVTLLIRSVLTVPAHAFFTIPLGVAMAFSKRAATLPRKVGWLLSGLSFSMTMHGLYNILVSNQSDVINRLAYLHVILLGVLALGLMRLRLPPLPVDHRPLDHRPLDHHAPRAGS